MTFCDAVVCPPVNSYLCILFSFRLTSGCSLCSVLMSPLKCQTLEGEQVGATSVSEWDTVGSGGRGSVGADVSSSTSVSPGETVAT